MTWEIRRVQTGDGERLRAVRLAALREYPSAFGETAEQAATLHPADWEARIARSCAPGRQILAVATDSEQGEFVGMLGGFIDSERDRPELLVPVPDGARWAMVWGAYVRRRARGSGLADQLLATVHRWAVDEARVDWIGLDVVETNTRAVRFYQRNGYTRTAQRRPYANNSALTEVVMMRRLDPGSVQSSELLADR
ncbi:GNAT family N-acetyltransferase [Nocardia salmonicida]|uniref:GNAT family N-acetyltransferase n=1 Tax=Nocardia salmonicida TaxID=53431 RepID=UPI0007A55AB9|nr:GNAT family N-acetyltransferase [Nocardia salmonicida]MBC7299552.1 GNAT family N-acetyltransferase [Nocardia sp.]